MSCVAVLMPKAPVGKSCDSYQTPGIFRGDADHLVDDLISACERKPTTGYGGFGRELVRWADDSTDSALSQALEAKSRQIDASPSKFPQGSHKHARPTSRSPASPDHKNKGGQVKRTKTRAAGEQLVAAVKRSAPTRIPAANPTRRTSLDKVVSSEFACPAFASSPKPEDLPMPTSSLLTRALTSGRSPSPLKMADLQAENGVVHKPRMVPVYVSVKK
eukprot:jgi/Chrzof1/12770/Cz07g06260.t1